LVAAAVYPDLLSRD